MYGGVVWLVGPFEVEFSLVEFPSVEFPFSGSTLLPALSSGLVSGFSCPLVGSGPLVNVAVFDGADVSGDEVEVGFHQIARTMNTAANASTTAPTAATNIQLP